MLTAAARLGLTAPPHWSLSDWHLDADPLAAVLTGFGTRLGGGCTSGHGVCGIACLSKRSLLATAAFMGSAIVVVFVLRHIFGA